MSYLVLARKWRPQSFADLVGQEHVGRTLANAIKTGRVHHAFLFTGARGVGKTSAARIFAKALNCESGPTEQPCNTCPNCLEISTGQGTDVLEIDGASNTGVDDVRELRENIRYLPSRSRYKIFIIDEVHMLSINAFNALLKTLEEPPAHAKFIFATTEPHKIPVTILSRCQRFDFRKIALPKILDRLREISAAENIEVSERALALVARRGEGSMRDALSTLDQVIAFCGAQVDDDEVQSLLGMVDRRLLLDAVEGVLQRDGRRVLDALRRVDDQGFSFRRFCQELVEAFRALILLKVVEEPGDLVDMTPDELDEYRALAEPVALEDLERAMTLLLKSESELPGASFPRLILEMALIRLAQLPKARDIGSLLRKLETLEQRLAGGEPRPAGAPRRESSPPVREAPPPPEAPPPQSEAPPVPEPPAKKVSPPPAPDSGSQSWQGLVDMVRGRRPLLASILEHAIVLCAEVPRLEIGFPAGSFHLDQLRDPENLQALQELAGTYYGTPVTIKPGVVEGDSPAPRSLAQERQAKKSAGEQRMRDETLAHPKVQAVLKIFGGKVAQIKALEPAAMQPENEEPSE